MNTRVLAPTKPLNHQPSASQAPPIVHEVLRAPGQPLDAATRAFMEPRFGHDFSRVRVHTDGQAAESARAVNALAYTIGRDVVFGAGLYAPQTPPGLRLLAHELTHVLQQRGVNPTDPLALGAVGDVYEQEAQSVSQVVSASPVRNRSHPINNPPVSSVPTSRLQAYREPLANWGIGPLPVDRSYWEVTRRIWVNGVRVRCPTNPFTRRVAISVPLPQPGGPASVVRIQSHVRAHQDNMGPGLPKSGHWVFDYTWIVISSEGQLSVNPGYTPTGPTGLIDGNLHSWSITPQLSSVLATIQLLFTLQSTLSTSIAHSGTTPNPLGVLPQYTGQWGLSTAPNAFRQIGFAVDMVPGAPGCAASITGINTPSVRRRGSSAQRVSG